MATIANDYLYENIKNNTERFGGFAALSMHDPAQAAAELNRTVTKYGFVGALLNDYQQSGADNSTLLFYDQPEYDVLWQMATDLDVPIYMHPRLPITQEIDLLWEGRKWLLTAPWQFANDLSSHVLGLAVNGVFDRFPSLRVIVGHNGERIPSDFWRADHMLERQKLLDMPMNGTVGGYLKKNIWITTSGEFYNDLVRYHIGQLGADRVLFSVDYPYETIEQASSWFSKFPFEDENERYMISRGNAINVLKLQL
ncbi:amidohydrolase 2 [Heliocybe sulcata]|uniref:Amidohydrolase 2 n=1 Tax=Heliocybe sulcata TaxID=5364 RepID=A0A5C3N5F4_9AGAM|nr:amidohydrolase 2 [Heliocybe sulcata]